MSTTYFAHRQDVRADGGQSETPIKISRLGVGNVAHLSADDALALIGQLQAALAAPTAVAFRTLDVGQWFRFADPAGASIGREFMKTSARHYAESATCEHRIGTVRVRVIALPRKGKE